MAKIIVVTSGKGGVGKTTTSASFSAGLALRGHKSAVIDFDVGLRNLDLIMGCERRVVYDLINVIHKEAKLTQALIKDKQCDNLYVLAASQTRDKDALTQDGVERVLMELAEMGFEYIICDSPAGIETGALMAMHFADEALIVTNPEVSSVRDSDRILGMLGSKTKRAIDGKEAVKEHLLITRYNPSRVISKCSLIGARPLIARWVLADNIPRMRSLSRTEETSGLVTTSASSAKCMAISAPVSMPAGESQTMYSKPMPASSVSTRSTPSCVSASLSRVWLAAST